MASKIKGITIEIGGNTTKLGKALDGVEKQSKSLQSELKGVNSLLKLDPSNVELLRQKQDLLTKSIDETSEKQKILQNTLSQIDSGKVQVTEEQYRDLQREIVYTDQKLESLTKELKTFGSVGVQQAKAIGDELKETGSKIEEAGSKVAGLSTVAVAGLGLSAKSAADNEAAINKYIATTGKAVEETDRYKEVMEAIYNNNYGDSIADVADKMRIVSNILGELPEAELQSVVEKSYMLQDAYDMDFQENIRGINSLMDQFGITSEQAFELINQGAQKGLNQNKDLTDQIAEYSTYYASLGFTAEEFFNIMIAGSKDGAYQIDYLNDAMKEFGIRTKDNSTGTINALDAMGLNADEIMKKFAQGGETAQEAFGEVTKSLMALEDPVKRNELGVQLFGTKWEDLEENAVNAMTTAKEEVDMLGNTVESTSDTMYGGAGEKAQEAVRSIQTAFASLGQSLLPIIASIASKIAELAEKFSGLSPTIQKIILVITGLVAAAGLVLIFIGKIVSAVGILMPVFAKIGAVLSKAPVVLGAIKTAIMAVVGTLGWPVTLILGIIAVIVLLWNKCDWFRNLLISMWEGIKIGLEVAVEFISNILLNIGQFFVGLYENIKNGLSAAWTWIVELLSTVGQWIYDNVIIPIMNFFQPLFSWFSQLFTSIKDSIASIINVIVGLFRGCVLLIQIIWGVVASWFNENVIIPIMNFFTPIVEFFRNLFVQTVTVVKNTFVVVVEWFKNRWNDIKKIFSVVNTWFGDKFSQAVSNIKKIFSPVGSFFSGIWSNIKNAFGKVTSWFKNTFSEAWTAVKNVFSTGGKIFDGIKEGISSTFKTVVNGIIGGINKVISIPFNSINNLLNQIRNVSVAGISPFKSFIKHNALSIPQIPKLKVGTNRVKEEGLAYLHKNEAVVSEKYNPAVHDDVMKDSLMDALTNFTNTKVRGASNQGSIGDLTKLLKEYMPLIVENIGREIVLDDRTLVGKLAPKLDKELGVISANKTRGY